MAELNIPNFNKKSEKYLFKKKLSLRRKPKSRLLSESFFMLVLILIIFYLNYLIPNKFFLFKNFFGTLEKLFFLVIDLFAYIPQLFLVGFILLSVVFSIILMLGIITRLLKVLRRKTRQISYK